METTLLINPAVTGKFKAVLKHLEQCPKQNINVKLISEDGNYFTVEYEKPRDLFNLGRAFEPYKPPANDGGSFQVNYDNGFINNI